VSLVAISVASLFVLRAILDREIDATVLNVAAIQAASLTDDPRGAMHFHDWELTPQEAASVQDLVRYAQVWQSDGVSLLRSQYMTNDLPLDTTDLRAAASGELVWTKGRFEDVPVRVLYYPLERLGEAHELHVLQVAAPTRSRDALLQRAGLFLMLLTVGVSVATFTGSRWLAGRAIRPIHEVIDQAESVEPTSLDRRIEAYADTREYRRLVDVINTMLGRIQSAFDAQRRFSADASHELRSPLTAMRGELELALRRERHPDEYRRVLGSTLEEVVRLSQITDNLLLLARSDSGAFAVRREPVDVGGVARSVVERLTSEARAKRLTVDLDIDDDATAQVDPMLVGQVVWNVVENALKFTPEGGTVVLAVRADAERVRLRVDDTGPGVGDVAPDRLFDRFYRGDGARTRAHDRSGVGLGLAIVKAVADAHGGGVAAWTRESGGTSVEVWFPRRADQG
jgi:two-component system OmpR family sensor kinase